ncbi:TrbC/VirB2 family protein [Novosphingobium sp. B-7]|uniref:TrbC/VirB2 family protein n=1 Tax=Novosphingobium sp. B-7 TaxID=1298855 RepID=UPI0011D1DB19|nr:TrbC/VirB2 family protein [Novosphingobium sp. B-7]
MNAGTASLFEPAHTQALGAMADWLREVLSGSLATALGIVAISLVGLSLFQGRLRLKHAAFVVLGVFLLLGAPIISAGITGNLPPALPVIADATVASPPVIPQNSPALSHNPFDPYAGASVPTQ